MAPSGRSWNETIGYLSDECRAIAAMVSLAVSTGLSGLADYLGSKNTLTPFILSCVNTAVSVALFTVLFAAIYKVLPDTPIGWRDVGTGAFLTALLVTAGKGLIGWYLGTTATRSGNGAAGALIVILLGTYYSEQMFLFGSEVTKAIADVRSKPMASEARRIDNPSEVARSRSL
jgi:membrane protein